MALQPTYSNLIANAAIDAMAALHNGGWVRFYSAPQPPNPDTPITTQILLAELTFSATAFAPSVNGVATANAIANDPLANNTGIAAWYRTFRSDGTTPLMDGSVGTSGTNIIIVNTSIAVGQAVAISAFTITFTKV